jgi:MFS family permease
VWTVLAFHAREIGYGADVVGYIGLVSVIGALFAARAGALADRRGTLFIGTIAWAFMLAAFAAYGLLGATIWGVLAASALLALGTQWTQIANQTRIFALDDSARSRINTIYMFNNFAGGACGSLLAAWTYDAGGWRAFCLASFVEVALMAVFLLQMRAGCQIVLSSVNASTRSRSS